MASTKELQVLCGCADHSSGSSCNDVLVGCFVELIVIMKKTIAILALAAAGLTTLNANAGIHVGINAGSTTWALTPEA